MDALHLREQAWKPLLSSEEGLELMFPIFAHLLDENGNSLVGAKQEQLNALLDAAAERIPDVVPKIYGSGGGGKPIRELIVGWRHALSNEGTMPRRQKMLLAG